MSRRKRGYDVERRTDSIAARVKESSGDNPIVFLDTGAIIDFEKEIRSSVKLTDSTFTPSRFYGVLLKKLPPMFVSEDILEEITIHNREQRINNLPEVSDETFSVACRLHKDYCDLLLHVEGNAFEKDELRYHVYWAVTAAFPENHKKLLRDPPSRADRELLATALWTRYALVPHNSGGDCIPVSSSTIISPDRHINGAIKVLSEHYRYSGLKAVSSR